LRTYKHWNLLVMVAALLVAVVMGYWIFFVSDGSHYQMSMFIGASMLVIAASMFWLAWRTIRAQAKTK